jgi:hypothetical protein
VSAAPTPARRRTVAGVLALLSCAAVITLSACDTGESTGGGSGGSRSSGSSEHEGGRSAPHTGTHPSSEHRTTAPTQPSEFTPRNCPTGLVC